MMCARCEELEIEVAYLRQELRGHDGDVLRVQKALGLQASSAHVLLRLYASKGRMVEHAQLLESIPSDNPDRGLDNVKVRVALIRRVIGYGVIESVWGQGYILTPAGVAKVAAILSPAAVAA